MDPIVWKGVEHSLIAIGAIIFGCLGYRLYVEGLARKDEKAGAGSWFLRFALSGTGPGLTFMAFGAVLLYLTLSSNEEPAPSPGDMDAFLNPIKEQLAGREQEIGRLMSRLPEEVEQQIQLEVSAALRAAERNFLDEVRRQLTGYETNLQERVSSILYESLEENSRQAGVVNNILEDHEERIVNLESQVEEINPVQDRNIPR